MIHNDFFNVLLYPNSVQGVKYILIFVLLILKINSNLHFILSKEIISPYSHLCFCIPKL